MITARKLTDPTWPEVEASPYADWWFLSDAGSGLFDIGGSGQEDAGFTALSFARLLQTGAAERFKALPTSQSADDIARKMPMWKGALPPATGPALGDDPVAARVPAKEFGGVLDPTNPPPAVMVVIDTDLNPAHAQFRNAGNATRILAHWLMEARWRNDARVPFGREIRSAEIDCATAGRTEDAALRRLGVADFTTVFAPRGAGHPMAHGTHVLALAAGADPASSSPEAAVLRSVPILAVSLPSNRLLSASGVFLDVFVDQALEWVSTRLTELYGATWPEVVVNLSYGLAAGPKDGSGYLNNRLRDWLEHFPKARLFMPAGNDGLAEGHAVLCPEEGRGAIGWMVPPGGAHSTFAEVWLSGHGPETELVLTPPDQTQAIRTPLRPGSVVDLVRTSDGPSIGRVYVLMGASADTIGCLICLAATRPHKAAAARARAGRWIIAVAGPQGLRAEVHLQSERALNVNGHNSQPSRLVALSGTGAKPQQAGTLNSIGPGTGAIIVNGLNDAARKHLIAFGPAGCSARPLNPPQDALLSGPLAHWTSRGGPPGPTHDAEALADRSRALPGQPSPGYRSGSTAVVEGTSFSTALAARQVLMRILQPPIPPPD